MTAKTSHLLFEDTVTHWANVILPLALPNNYTYAIPVELLNSITIGGRVEVELRNKKYSGIVAAIHQVKPAYISKPILNVLDEEPLLYASQLKLWSWMATYYMCTEGEVMAAALPTNFKLSSETILVLNDEAGDDFTHLTDNEYLVAEALQIKKELKLSEVQEILDAVQVYPIIKKLIEKQVCVVWESLEEKYKIKKENYVVLNPIYRNEDKLSALFNDWKGAPKQMELLLAYLHISKTEGDVQQASLLKKANASAAQLKGLVDKDVLWIERRSVDRIQSIDKTVDVAFDLSPAQEIAYQEVKKTFKTFDITLLHGVTGSGKTQVYVKLIEEAFKAGQQVLYLLPEIALTAQIIRRLQKHFGGNITVYHSKFNNHERVELWNKIRTGQIQIVLGARSALLLPFKNLGLIIVDEEHDASYKQQEPNPKYNARDTAIFYASLFKAELGTSAKVLLGSATPAIESYSNAKAGKYGFVEINERFGNIELPQIELIDTKQVVQTQKEKVMLSPQLKEAIQQTLDKKKQVILFQNRRGYNPYLICGGCGYIPKCTHCSVSLTLHKYSNKLHCHYCASQYPKLVDCIACGKTDWREKNFGTEKIEELIEAEFKDYKVARMDVDSIRGKKAHDNLIHMLEQKKIDILVGTQMVVKGLDFDDVALVGVLDADGILSFADFRVNERAFQIMEQVSGRAGRKNEQGRVFIQTSNPNHFVLQLVTQHNYKALFEVEIKTRQDFFYPPFCRLINITLKHKIFESVNAAALQLAKSLQQDMAGMIVGPAAPMINRIRNQYLMEIMVKMPKDKKEYKSIIKRHIQLINVHPNFKSVQIVIDVDPI